MSWDRAAVSAALAGLLGPAVEVTVHPRPPETLNPLCVVVDRPTSRMISGAAFGGVDEVELALFVVGGVETEDQIEAIKRTCEQTLLSDPTLGGVVRSCFPTEERNWRNLTGAGGVQLLLVELILTIQM